MKCGYFIRAAILGLAASFSASRAAEHTKDTPQEVKKAVADGKAVLLDVREKDEWDAGHIKGARCCRSAPCRTGSRQTTWPRRCRRARWFTVTTQQAGGLSRRRIS